MAAYADVVHVRGAWRQNRPARRREHQADRGRCPRCGEHLVAVVGRLVCIVAACRLSGQATTAVSPTTARAGAHSAAEES